MKRPSRIGVLAASVGTAVILVLSGCAGSAGSSGASATHATSTADASGVMQAQSLVKQYSAVQPAVTVAPLKSKPPTGKTLAIITCPFPSCQQLIATAKTSAQKLGWNVKSYGLPMTAEGYVSTWTQALQASPDMIAYIAVLPNSAIKDQLATARRLKIAVVAISPTAEPGGAVRATIAGKVDAALTGKLMGATVVAASRGRAKTVFVWDSSVSGSFGTQKDAYTRTVAATGGSVDVLEVQTAQVGRAIPGQVVSYLQSHPDTKYVVLCPSALGGGVNQALKTANLASTVKVVGMEPSATDLADIKSGQQYASVATESETVGYRVVDTMARILEGMPFNPNPVGAQQILTRENVGTSTEPATRGATPQAFFTAWHVR